MVCLSLIVRQMLQCALNVASWQAFIDGLVTAFKHVPVIVTTDLGLVASTAEKTCIGRVNHTLVKPKWSRKSTNTSWP